MASLHVWPPTARPLPPASVIAARLDLVPRDDEYRGVYEASSAATSSSVSAISSEATASSKWDVL
jgi:hypothetical protein